MPLPITTPISRVYAGQAPVWSHQNPEMADIDNPHGDVYETKFVIIAETAAGSRFQHCGVFDTSPDRLVARIELAGVINLQLWAETFEVYGSAAWENADRERELAWRSNPATQGTVRDY